MEEPTDKKHAIFESTLELIKDQGFHGAPMSLVARKAGVAAGTIYHYFESKEKLILELYDYNRDRITRIIEASVKKNSSYQENFFNIWANLYRFYVHEPNVLIFFEQFVNSPFNESKFPNFTSGRLYSFLSEGVRNGALKSIQPEILLVLMMGSINATAKLHLFGKLPLSQQDLRRICGILWDGIVSAKSTNTTIK